MCCFLSLLMRVRLLKEELLLLLLLKRFRPRFADGIHVETLHCPLIRLQDTKKKKREPKAGSVEDWETGAQSVSLG